MFIELRRDAAFLSRLSLCVILHVAGGVDVHAQDSSGVQATTANTSTSCWRGKPRPRCNKFLITEVGFYGRLLRPVQHSSILLVPNQPRHEIVKRSAPWVLALEVGAMRNVSQNTALGGTIAGGFPVNNGAPDSDGAIFGARARYRRWLSAGGAALDLGIGLESRADPVKVGPRPAPGLTMEVAFNYADHMALVARYDRMRFSGTVEPELSFGIRMGGKPALIGGGGLAVTYVTLFSMLLSGFGR